MGKHLMKRSGKSYNQQIQCSASNRTLQLWTHSPYEPHVDGDWLYGRGSGDMKAGLVAFCLAFQALRDMGLQPASPVILQSVIEEECTGNGALACLEADAHKQITGTECKGVASTATTDARFFQIYGRISATCYDPTAENIHGINERVSISSTLQVAEVLALFLANWCSVETL